MTEYKITVARIETDARDAQDKEICVTFQIERAPISFQIPIFLNTHDFDDTEMIQVARKHSASDLYATCCREQGLETDNRRDAASFEIKFASNETSRLARAALELRQCKQAMRAATMTVTESKGLKKGSRVYWRGDATDGGKITGTSWYAVTIAWDNGQVAIVYHGDMREIQRSPARSVTV